MNFRYDPAGRRIQKTSSSGTVNYLYDGANVLEEVDASGNLAARYTQSLGMDEPLAMLRSSTTSYSQVDGIGSVTSLSNSSGALANTYTYDSFGRLTASSGTITNPYRFTGRELDSETGLYYYRARYYDPAGGRFISEDAIRFKGGVNFYAYAGNSPTLYIDPSGYVCCTPEKRRFFTWLNDPLAKMASDLATDKTLLLTLAAKEGGWTTGDLNHNMPLSNPFGVNKINSKGQAAGNINYTALAGGNLAAGLSLAIQSWENQFGNRVQGVNSADDFAYGLQHPEQGKPYNSVNPNYENDYQDLVDTMKKYMEACGIQ